MANLKKIGVLSVTLLATAALTACNSEPCPKYLREEDEVVYERVLGDYNRQYAKAKGISDDSERFVAYAQAEALLLDSGSFMPTTTQGGNYAVTRIAPRTVPYCMWGNDDDRMKGTVVVKHQSQKPFITSEDRAALLTQWAAAKKGEGTYDPAAYLKGKGYEISDEYVYYFSTFPETLDILNTSMQADTESLVNGVEGLLEYNNLGQAVGQIAESWDYEVKQDAKGNDYQVWTFNLKSGRYWYKADGTQVAEVVADDFVAGFQHMLDAQAGLEWLTQGIIKGADEYIKEKTKDFGDVGVKAIDAHTLQFTLCLVESFFPTRLTYSCFMPMNRQYFLDQGGAFGVAEYKTAAGKDTYKYGLVSDRNSVLYNGPYTPSQLTDGEVITYKANNKYSEASKISSTTLKWIYDAGENPTAYYEACVNGTGVNGTGLGEASGILAKAKADGIFDTYKYIVDTNATTYFGGFNVNRGTFEVGSVKSNASEAKKTFTHRAFQNKNFRNAIQHAWDRKTQNAVSVGEELAALSLRNMYTAPEFVSLTKDVTWTSEDGKTTQQFKAGTAYGDVTQWFLTNVYGRNCQVKDGVDGWYNPTEAKAFFTKAKEELGEYVEYPVQIDIEYYSASASNTAQAQAVKKSIEESLGTENVVVNLTPAATSADYYAAGYRAADGKSGCFDIFYGSGWGPDYGDPSSYLDTFLGDGAGYMTKVLGLF